MKLTKQNRAIDRMVELIERDHGGCDDPECSLRQMLESHETTAEELIWWWACSGAADTEFNHLFDEYGQHIEQLIRDGR